MEFGMSKQLCLFEGRFENTNKSFSLQNFSCCSCAISVAVYIAIILVIAFAAICVGVYFGFFNLEDQPELAKAVNETLKVANQTIKDNIKMTTS
jgi:hypothetical protein